MQTVKDLIKQWPSAKALGDDINEADVTVRQWGNRNSIPLKHWSRISKAAKSRKLKGITVDALMRLHISSSGGDA